MTVPIKSIAASLEVPHLVELKPGQKNLRLVIRATLRNDSEESIVLHAPSRDHEHFWHVFDERGVEIDREHGSGKGGQKDSDKPLRFRSLTLAPGQECHETRTIRIDAGSLLAGTSRCLLRGEIWGQSAEAEFHTVVRPARLTAARRKPSAKKAVRKKATKKRAPAKKAAMKKAPRAAAGKKSASKRK